MDSRLVRDAFRRAIAYRGMTTLPRSPVAGVLRQIAVRRLFTDVVLFVVAMTPSGVEGDAGRAAGAFVALIVLRNGTDGSHRMFRHRSSPSLNGEKR